jgi:ATP-dependent helicase Lhr and Lhr-like helicase
VTWVSRRAAQGERDAGVIGTLLRRVSQIRPRQWVLKQAEREVLEDELDVRRVQATLEKISALKLEVRALKRPTPFGLPLMVERFRERLSNETLSARIDRMVAQLEKAADA